MDPNSDIAETEQKIVMFWGEGLEAKILRDIWVLTVSSMTWKEVGWFSLGVCAHGELLPHINWSYTYNRQFYLANLL